LAYPSLEESEVSPGHFYKLDLRKGILLSTETNERVVTLSSRGCAALREDLYSRFLTGADVILFDMGLSFGREFAKSVGPRIKSMVMTRDSRFSIQNVDSVMRRIGTFEGWGKISIREDPSTGEIKRKIIFSISDCAFCIDSDTCHSCQFFRGVAESLMVSMSGGLYESSANCKVNPDGVHVCEVFMERV
jgi:hypothetical protein